MGTAAARLLVFLCHSSADKPAVRHLHGRLITDGFQPWLDEEELVAGQDWDREIQYALKRADAIVLCLSHSSVSKEGYVQREVRRALARAEEMPPGTVFLIPVKLDACEVPIELEHLQWVNLYEGSGYGRLIQGLTVRAAQLQKPPNE